MTGKAPKAPDAQRVAVLQADLSETTDPQMACPKGSFRSTHELAPARLGGRMQEFDQLGDDHVGRWAVVLTCKHAALGVR